MRCAIVNGVPIVGQGSFSRAVLCWTGDSEEVLPTVTSISNISNIPSVTAEGDQENAPRTGLPRVAALTVLDIVSTSLSMAVTAATLKGSAYEHNP
jgi:hypothetical protein